MLHSDQRIVGKRRQRKRITTLSQRFRIERRSIISEESLHDVEYRRLTRTRFAVEDNEFVNLTAIASQDSSDSPFNLLSFLGIVECTDEFVPIHRLAIRQRIRQSKRRVIILSDGRIGKYRFTIERAIGIDHVFDPESIPLPHAITVSSAQPRKQADLG